MYGETWWRVHSVWVQEVRQCSGARWTRAPVEGGREVRSCSRDGSSGAVRRPEKIAEGRAEVAAWAGAVWGRGGGSGVAAWCAGGMEGVGMAVDLESSATERAGRGVGGSGGRSLRAMPWSCRGIRGAALQPSIFYTGTLELGSAGTWGRVAEATSRFPPGRQPTTAPANMPAIVIGLDLRVTLPAVLPAVLGSASRFPTLLDPHGLQFRPRNAGFSGVFSISRSASEADALSSRVADARRRGS